MRRMRVFGEHNWQQYTTDEVTKMRGHLLKYPVEIDRMGKVKLLRAYIRTVRSVAHLLAKYQDVKIYFVSPNAVKMKITVDVDGDLRFAYFRQAKNSLYIRMALLNLLLLGWCQIVSKMHSVYHDFSCLFLDVDLSTSKVSTFQDAKVCGLSYQAALPEVLEILKSACETHELPLAQT
ncbi:hypothetical protein T459_29440 [Capsicum annuum]|uniref:Uncharacterized protein n=1 Tax=Capsicum annuum TaxID=4072 RepID=A0A2G2Y5I8_CAPAN|nr:hypothetical protein T459_29440 [Capsicum annuum]